MKFEHTTLISELWNCRGQSKISDEILILTPKLRQFQGARGQRFSGVRVRNSEEIFTLTPSIQGFYSDPIYRELSIMSPNFHPLTISDIRKETDAAVCLTFDVPAALEEAYRFTQGQYLTLRAEIDGTEVRRSYSICSGVDDGKLRVAVKKITGGVFSTYANEELGQGDVMEVMPPQGTFFTPAG